MEPITVTPMPRVLTQMVLSTATVFMVLVAMEAFAQVIYELILKLWSMCFHLKHTGARVAQW